MSGNVNYNIGKDIAVIMQDFERLTGEVEGKYGVFRNSGSSR
jgi:hypothetical protein